MSPNQIKAKIWMSAAKGAVLPFATLMVVLFMMVPVPAFMLDVGFITNIMISLAVRARVSQISRCWRVASAPACAQSSRNALPMAVSESVHAASRCWSCAASADCSCVCDWSTLRSSVLACC